MVFLNKSEIIYKNFSVPSFHFFFPLKWFLIYSDKNYFFQLLDENTLLEKSLFLSKSLELFKTKIESIVLLLSYSQPGTDDFVNLLNQFKEALLPEHIPVPGRDPRFPKRIHREIFNEFQRVIYFLFILNYRFVHLPRL